MVQGRSRGSPGGTRRSGMVLAAVLLMVMVAQTRGKSQLSMVEDIDKSLENILRDVESLQQYTNTSTTPRETTPGGSSTPAISTETSTEFSVSTTETTDFGSSSSDTSNAPTDTTATTSQTSTAAPTTMTTLSIASTATATVPTTSTTTTTVPTYSTTTTTDPTTTTTTVTTSSTTTTTDPTTTTVTTSSTPVTTDPTTTTTTTEDPAGPKSNNRVKRRTLLSLATLDDALIAWVDPKNEWFSEEMSTETSDVTADITSSEYIVSTSSDATTPVSDQARLEAALWVADQVVTQVAAGTITDDQVKEMQAAEAEVKDVTDSPDVALQEALQENPGLLDNYIEGIKKNQATIDDKVDELKKHNTSVIVGSVLGGLLVIVLVAVGVVCYMRHIKKKNNGGRNATKKRRSQSASGSAQQQMVELGSNLDEFPQHDELPPHSLMPPNPLIPRVNLDNFSLSSAQRNITPEPTRISHLEPSMQVGEMRTEPGIENPGYVEEFPPRPVVPPKPRNRPSTFDKFGLSPTQMRIEQEPSKQGHYLDELNYRLAPRDRQVRPVGGNYHSPTEPNRRISRDPSLRRHQHHQHPGDHRVRHRNDRHVRRIPSVPPPDYTMPRDRHQSPDNLNARKHHSQKQQPPRSPYEFEAPRTTSAPPKSEAPRPERNRSDIRRPYGPEDLY